MVAGVGRHALHLIEEPDRRLRHGDTAEDAHLRDAVRLVDGNRVLHSLPRQPHGLGRIHRRGPAEVARPGVAVLATLCGDRLPVGLCGLLRPAVGLTGGVRRIRRRAGHGATRGEDQRRLRPVGGSHEQPVEATGQGDPAEGDGNGDASAEGKDQSARLVARKARSPG